MTIWLQLVICAAVILYAGSQLSQYGELIADKSGFGKNWVGLVLLAIIASSPQLVTSISAVVAHDLPDLAVGGLMGSCMFNMLVIGLLDLFSRHKPVSHVVHHGHILSAGFGIILLGLVAIDIFFGKNLPAIKVFNLIDPLTLSFVPIYLIAMRISYRFEKTRLQELETKQSHEIKENQSSWFKLLVPFFIYAACIIVASLYLPLLAEHIGTTTGWGQSFIGLSLVAITTCLPEIAISTSAAKRGSFDVAVASLLGSNLFYVVILAITDFCYQKAPLLRHVSSSNALAAMAAIISMAIAIIALTYKSEKKFLFIAGDAAALIFVYLSANVLLFNAH